MEFTILDTHFYPSLLTFRQNLNFSFQSVFFCLFVLWLLIVITTDDGDSESVYGSYAVDDKQMQQWGVCLLKLKE